jgi:hypothetical protein
MRREPPLSGRDFSGASAIAAGFGMRDAASEAGARQFLTAETTKFQ